MLSSGLARARSSTALVLQSVYVIFAMALKSEKARVPFSP